MRVVNLGVTKEPRDNIGDSVERERRENKKKKKWMFRDDQEEIHTKSSRKGKG